VLRDALTTVFQKARAAKVASISRLSITPFEVSHIFMLLSVVEAVPNASKTSSLNVEFEMTSGTLITLTAEGAVADVKQLRDFVEPQVRAAAEKNVHAAIHLAFGDGGLQLSGDEPDKIGERLTRFGTSAAFVEATVEA
jgi:preprotein translocase subunit SecF